jgi:hypothetical protein
MLCEGTNIPSDVMRQFTVPKNRQYTHTYILELCWKKKPKNPHRIEGNKKYNFWEDIKYIQCI